MIQIRKVEIQMKCQMTNESFFANVELYKHKSALRVTNLTIKLSEFRQLTEKLRIRYVNSNSSGQLPHRLYKMSECAFMGSFQTRFRALRHDTHNAVTSWHVKSQILYYHKNYYNKNLIISV